MTLTTVVVALSLAGFVLDDDAPARPPAAEPSPWRYVVPPPGDSFAYGPFHALVLIPEKPEELTEEVGYRGDPALRLYAQAQFGSLGSTRVTIVVDAIGSGQFDLYADADRDFKIDDRDRVTGPPFAAGPHRERIWRLPLGVTLVKNGAVRSIPRTVALRLGASGQTLGYAAAGYLEGKITLGGQDNDAHQPRRTLTVRRVDGDGNGLLANPQDRIWIDLNQDGHFDAGSEQFSYTSVLNLQGSRYVVRSDELGSRLAFDPPAGAGTLRLAWKGNKPLGPVRAVEMHATAFDRDGSVFTLSGSESATVPAADYRLGAVTISLDDPTDGQRWSFVFSDAGARGQPRWYKVPEGAAITIDPIGTPTFELKREDQTNAARPGQDIVLQPALYTGAGLLIVDAYRGNPDAPAVQDLPGARIELLTTGGTTLATAHSGFSRGAFRRATVRVPESPVVGSMNITADFDSGPLAGPLQATTTIDVRK